MTTVAPAGMTRAMTARRIGCLVVLAAWVPAAMLAGITDQLWSFEDLFDAVIEQAAIAT